jgi:hypothetical protein
MVPSQPLTLDIDAKNLAPMLFKERAAEMPTSQSGSALSIDAAAP